MNPEQFERFIELEDGTLSDGNGMSDEYADMLNKYAATFSYFGYGLAKEHPSESFRLI